MPRRRMSAKRYVYLWADCIYLEARLEDERQCNLAIIGATPKGKKELVGFTDCVRESAQRCLGGPNQLPKLIQGVKLNGSPPISWPFKPKPP